MSDKVELKHVTLKGFMQADQVTLDNIQDFAESLNGTIDNGMLLFEIHKHPHIVLPGDWVVFFSPHGDVQVYTDSMFNRILELEPAEVG